MKLRLGKRMNGAIGMSDIEGKAAMGSGERCGSRASFKHRSEELLLAYLVLENLCQSVFICGFFSVATRSNVAMIRAPAKKVPRNVPDTLDIPPVRQRWFTGI